MPRYIEVVSAVSETAQKVLALRAGTLRGTRREIKVTTLGGRTASVMWSPDLSHIQLNMPSLPPDANLNRTEADRLVAFIIHECCHCLHSDRAAWERAVRAGARVRDWTNALEDVRIEQKEIKAGAFPAMGGLLASMANHLHFESVVEARKHGRVIGARVADAPYVAAILGRLANGYAIPAATGLAGAMSANVQRLMAVALPGVRQCRNTDNVRYLAEQLVTMEQGMRPQQPDDPGQGDEGQGTESEGTEGEGTEGTEGEGTEGTEGEGTEGTEGEGTEGTEGEGTEGTEGEGTEGTEGTEGEGTEGTEDGAGIPTDADLSETIRKIAERAGIADVEEHAELNPGHVLATSRSTIKAAPAGDHGTGAHGVAAGQLNARLPRNSVLHGQIGRLLVSAEVRRVTHHESSGRLDRRALVRMRAGATDVYSRRDDQPGIDTALMILIDGSASMESRSTAALAAAVATLGNNATRKQILAAIPSRMMTAQAAAWHIAKAAEAANAKVCVAAFHSPRGEHGEFLTGGQGAAITVVKPWDVPAADRAAHLAAVDPDGGTPLSPAIMAAADMLSGVNATRHICMVLTDGECDLGPDAVTRACTLAGDVGVEVVGIGMMCASVTAAFPPRYSVNVKNLDQLAQAGLGVLVQMLEDANPRGAD